MSRFDLHDTIAAISTALGPAQRGVVRVSGPRALDIALEHVKAPGGHSVEQPVRAQVVQGLVTVPGVALQVACGVALWPGSRTYTGQPLAELHVLGSQPLLQALLAACLGAGARLAEPGEFTLRAFLNGRIDLTQAEAVMAVVDADRPGQLDAALAQLAGGLRDRVERLRARVLQLLAETEASLDFSEEPDVVERQRTQTARRLGEVAADLTALLETLVARDRAETRPSVVITGPPNAGKSQLFNALAGGEHALVSSRAGTTRDFLTCTIVCDGLPVELVDTAGVEAPSDSITAEAQAQRVRQAQNADLVLQCVSVDTAIEDEPLQPSASATLRVTTKADLGMPSGAREVATSARTRQGLDELKSLIARVLRDVPGEGGTVHNTTARCHHSLSQARVALGAAAVALAEGHGDEFVALELREVLEALASVVGAIFTEDILDQVFRQFCIGK